MKRIQLSLLAFALASLVVAQAPQAIKYQSVVRDNAGVELVNQNVGFRISVLQGSASGAVVYSETHAVSTNAYGLAHFNIGEGNVVSGDFATIDWGADTYFFKVDLDATGGTNYQFIGTSQALSVPYALHARTADSVTGGGTGQWTINGNHLHNANTGNVGVGITAPAQKLDVQGSALLRGAEFNGVGDSAALYLGDASTRVKNTFGTGLQLYSFPGTAPAMTIRTATNNVGIGLDMPMKKLDVQGSALLRGTGFDGIGDSAALYLGDVATRVKNTFGTGMQLYTYPGTTPAMTILTGTNNVGIGTAAPTAKLDVAGTVKIADGTQGDAKILTSDADGNASWQSLSAENLFGSGNVHPADFSCLNKVATIPAGDSPTSSAVAGNHAYVVNQYSNNMMVFDVSNPAAPSLIATIATGDSPRAVAVAGSHAYVVNNNNDNMMVFNISDPTAPSLSATIATGDSPQDVTVAGNHAYVVSFNTDDLMVFDISNPTTPINSATIAVGSSPRAVAVAGDYAYVVGQSGDMDVIDISNPAAPISITYIATGTAPNSVAVSGNYAYVLNYFSNNMAVVDLSNPAAPSISATIATGENPIAVAVEGNYAYVVNTTSDNMMVFEISNPAAPSLRGTIAITGGPLSVSLACNHAYVTIHNADALAVFNLSCPNMITMDPATGELTSQTAAWSNSGDNLVNTNSGNVGIGTSTPGQRLDVNGGLQFKDHLVFNSSNGVINFGPGGDLLMRSLSTQGNITTYTDRMVVMGNGNVGIGTSTPSQRLSVTGNICYTGTIGACSDRRYKTDFTPLSGSLAKVGLLNGLYYNWRTEEFPEKQFSADRQLGFVAQDIEALFPEVVLTDAQGYKSVDYGRLTPVLVEAIKELNMIVEKQQATINDQHAAINTMRTQLDANTTLMQQLQSVLEAQSRK